MKMQKNPGYIPVFVSNITRILKKSRLNPKIMKRAGKSGTLFLPDYFP